MSILVEGILRFPDNSPIVGASIKFVASKFIQSGVPIGASIVLVTNTIGAYSEDILEGSYHIFIKMSGQDLYTHLIDIHLAAGIGNVAIGDPITLEDIIGSGPGDTPVYTGCSDIPAPTVFTVSGGFTTIILNWSVPAYVCHAVTEIWIGATNVFEDKVLLDTTEASVYSHAIGHDGTRYYWIRFRNLNGNYGNWFSTTAVTGQTAQDPGMVLADLQQDVYDSAIFASLRTNINSSFYQAEAPTVKSNGDSLVSGDTWIDSDDNQRYVWDTAQVPPAWLAITDKETIAAAQALVGTQEVADGEIRGFFQATEPLFAESSFGDIWINIGLTTPLDFTSIKRFQFSDGTHTSPDLDPTSLTYEPDMDWFSAGTNALGLSYVKAFNTEGGLALLDNEYSTFVTNTVTTLTDLQTQLDGSITTWFQAGIPTVSNLPASAWSTEPVRINHLGDLYYDKDTGYAYRYAWEDIDDDPDMGTIFSWIQISDTAIAAALQAANDAQDTADGKRTIFYEETAPTTTDIGDMWVRISTGKTKTWSGTAWEETTNATADSAQEDATNAQEDATNAQTDATSALVDLTNIASDTILSPGEKPTVIAKYDVIINEQSNIEATATTYGVITEQTAYTDKVTALTTYLATLTSTVAWNVLTGNTTIVSADFSTAFNDVYSTRQTLLNKISTEAKVLADAAQEVADTAQAFVDDVFPVTQLAIQGQLDHQIMYTFDATATTTALEDTAKTTIVTAWLTTTPHQDHHGDFVYFELTGKAYSWDFNSVAWVENTDSLVIKSLKDASSAQDTADNKRRVFVDTPITPYDVGDLWTNDTIIQRCKNPKSTGDYSADDWIVASTYITTFYQDSEPGLSPDTSVPRVGDMWVNTTNSEDALYRYNGTTWQLLSVATLANVDTQITEQKGICRVIATGATTAHKNEALCEAVADNAWESLGALASRTDTVSTTVDTNTSTISTQATSINGLQSEYAVKIDNNGNVSGFGLSSVSAGCLVNGVLDTSIVQTACTGTGKTWVTDSSTFLVAADTFAITGTSETPVTPFIVRTGGATGSCYVNGTEVTAACRVDGELDFTVPFDDCNGFPTFVWDTTIEVTLAQCSSITGNSWVSAGTSVVGIQGSLVLDGTMNANAIVAGSITGDHIAGTTITGDHIDANSISASHIVITGGGKIVPSLIGAASTADMEGANGILDGSVEVFISSTGDTPTEVAYGFGGTYTDAPLSAVVDEMLAIIVNTAPVDQVLYDLITSIVGGYLRGDIDNSGDGTATDLAAMIDNDISIGDTTDVLRYIVDLEDKTWITDNLVAPMLADMTTYGSYFDPLAWDGGAEGDVWFYYPNADLTGVPGVYKKEGNDWNEIIEASIYIAMLEAYSKLTPSEVINAINNIPTDLNNNTTTIDGGKITTGTISAAHIDTAGLTANEITLSPADVGVGTTTENSRMEVSSNMIKIYDGGTLRVKLGYLGV